MYSWSCIVHPVFLFRVHPTTSGNFLMEPQLLLERGAKVHVQNKEGSTPLHLAVSEGETRIAEPLLDRGANIHVQNNEGQTPLQVASRSVKHLLSERMQSAQDVH